MKKLFAFSRNGLLWISCRSPFGFVKPVEPAVVIDALKWRYATKQFDPAKKIPSALWESLEDVLVLSPSSYGLQPWKFLVITDSATKAALRPHSWNQPQVTDCSHHVVFAIRSKIDDEYLDKYIGHMATMRGVARDSLKPYRQIISSYIITGPQAESAQEWATRQVYLALGNFMTSAALLGVDTCPMEGIMPDQYDQILGLTERGYKTVVACAAGYRAPEDSYAAFPKVRFAKSEMIQRI